MGVMDFSTWIGLIELSGTTVGMVVWEVLEVLEVVESQLFAKPKMLKLNLL